MKKKYQTPESEIVLLKNERLLTETSPEGETGGEGAPDSRRYNGSWSNED